MNYFNVPKFSEITILKCYKTKKQTKTKQNKKPLNISNVGTAGEKVTVKSLNKLLARNIRK